MMVHNATFEAQEAWYERLEEVRENDLSPGNQSIVMPETSGMNRAFYHTSITWDLLRALFPLNCVLRTYGTDLSVLSQC